MADNLTNLTSDETQSNLDKIRMYLWIYISPLILLPGLVGNFLAAVVITVKPVAGKPIRFLLMCLIISDSVALSFGLVRHWIKGITGTDLRSSNNEICKIHTFIVYLSLHLSSWILVLITLQRVFAIRFPFKAHVISSLRISVFGVVFCVIAIAIINAPLLYSEGIDEENDCYTIYGSQDFIKFVLDQKSYIDLTVHFILPFIILLCGNASMIFSIAKSSTLRLAGKTAGETRRNRSLTRMLIIINFVYFITTSPSSIVLLLSPTLFPSYDVYLITYVITSLMMYVNYGINFYLYFSTGNKFRSALFLIFPCFACVFRVTRLQPKGTLPMSVWSTAKSSKERNHEKSGEGTAHT